MKKQNRLMALFAVLIILSDCLSVKAEEVPEKADVLSKQTGAMQEDNSPENTTAVPENIVPKPATPDGEAALRNADAPVFHASVEYYSHGYYVVKGTFTEFLPDTSLCRPLYSLDGTNWKPCGRNWDLGWMNRTENEFAQENLQNQICLDNGDEPLKSYLDGKLDFFYLKLQIFRVNGDTYETQATLIERGGPQPAPAQSSAKQLPGENSPSYL